MGRMAALILLVLCLAAPCLAEPATPYAADTMLYYPMLTAPQQQLFDLIYHVVLRGMERIELPEGTSYDDARTAMEAVRLDCPELCALSVGAYSIGYTADQPEQAVAIVPQYCMEASRQSELVHLARCLAAGASGDEFTREWYFHDLLCRTVTYDLTASAPHTAWGALVEGRAVCDGYARAMTLLCRLAGIRCGMVSGTSTTAKGTNAHAWNILCIDGAWTQLDATFDDLDSEMITSYFYFNLTDEMISINHTPGDSWALPACTDMAANWHLRRCALAQSPEEAELQMMNGLRSLALGAAGFSLRLAREEDYLALFAELNEWEARYNCACLPGEELTGELQIYYCDEQQSVTIGMEKPCP